MDDGKEMGRLCNRMCPDCAVAHKMPEVQNQPES